MFFWNMVEYSDICPHLFLIGSFIVLPHHNVQQIISFAAEHVCFAVTNNWRMLRDVVGGGWWVVCGGVWWCVVVCGGV